MASPLLNFAIIGRRSSGKTCLLSALAMPREANPEGIHCTYSRNKDLYDKCVSQPEVEDFFKMGNSDSEELGDVVIPFDDMHKQTEIMLKNLSEGKLPGANPLSSRSAYIFNFSTKSRIQFDTAIFDYAGELVQNNSELSQNLMKFFKNMNGLIVVAEVCGSDDTESIKKHALEISELTSFFKAIENEEEKDNTRFNVPVALVISKFDKFENFNLEKYAAEGRGYADEVLQKYTKTKQGGPIRDLIGQIESVTAPDCFRVFPSSAIGSYVQGQEIPVPLPSVNILEPFSWIAEAYAKHTLTYLKENPKLAFTAGYSNKADLVCKLSPEGSERLSEASSIRCKSKQTKRLVNLGVFIVLVLIVFGVEGIIDLHKVFVIKNTKTSFENSNINTDWLKKYGESGILRHSFACLFFSKKDALEMRNKILGEHEELYWNNIQQTLEMEAKIEKAKEYLKSFPKAKHSEEARDMVEGLGKKIETAAGKSKFKEAVAEFSSQIDSFKYGQQKLNKMSFEALYVSYCNLKNAYSEDIGEKDTFDKLCEEYKEFEKKWYSEQIAVIKKETREKLSNDNVKSWEEAINIILKNYDNSSWDVQDRDAFIAEIMKDLEFLIDARIQNYRNNSTEELFKSTLSEFKKLNGNSDINTLLKHVATNTNFDAFIKNRIDDLCYLYIKKYNNEIVDYLDTLNNNISYFFQNRKTNCEKLSNLIDFCENNERISHYANNYKPILNTLNNLNTMSVEVTVKGLQWHESNSFSEKRSYGFGIDGSYICYEATYNGSVGYSGIGLSKTYDLATSEGKIVMHYWIHQDVKLIMAFSHSGLNINDRVELPNYKLIEYGLDKHKGKYGNHSAYFDVSFSCKKPDLKLSRMD